MRIITVSGSPETRPGQRQRPHVMLILPRFHVFTVHLCFVPSLWIQWVRIELGFVFVLLMAMTVTKPLVIMLLIVCRAPLRPIAIIPKLLQHVLLLLLAQALIVHYPLPLAHLCAT